MAIDVTIDTLSTQGDGIARHEGKIVFVPFVLPGERWRVNVHVRKKNYDRALPIERLSEPSPQRTAPSCPLFTSCGGCQIQHINYEHQLEWKRNWLEETFRRVGKLDVSCEPVVASQPLEYRNKVTIPVFHATKPPRLAFHQAERPNRALPITDCPIAHPLIRAAIPRVNAFLAGQSFRPRKRTPRWDETKFVFFVDDDRVVLEWHGCIHPASQDESMAERLQSHLPDLDSIRFVRGRSASTGSIRDEEKTSHSSAFRQVNMQIRDEMYAIVNLLSFQMRGTILDGYCGSGMLTRMLAANAVRVVGVESSHDAIAQAKHQAPVNMEFRCETMERFFQVDQTRFDVMVMNPPRAGLSDEVRNAITIRNPADVAILSCHPAAMVRDARHLVDHGYRIRCVKPFDMFPQTYHLETVVHFRKD